ncbi:MAG: HEAT repeat domain-containing protein [Desulfatitalea sp.]
MSDAIIPLDVQSRLLAKARSYVVALDQLLLDGEQAIDVLVRALPLADNDLKLKIVLMLGTMADFQVIGPLCNIMRDWSLAESLRHAASVQLSLVGGMVKGPESENLAAGLISDLESDNPIVRANAAFALGWDGNLKAVAPLVNALCDEDLEVQQAAVSALSNINDDRLFTALAERLKCGAKEQQRCILYHLCGFSDRQAVVAEICGEYLGHKDADLRYDALVVLDAVSEGEKPLAIYLRCIEDDDPRIREQALLLLSQADKQRLKPMAARVQPLVLDPCANIRQAAVRLLHHINDGPSAL